MKKEWYSKIFSILLLIIVLSLMLLGCEKNKTEGKNDLNENLFESQTSLFSNEEIDESQETATASTSSTSSNVDEINAENFDEVTESNIESHNENKEQNSSITSEIQSEEQNANPSAQQKPQEDAQTNMTVSGSHEGFSSRYY